MRIYSPPIARPSGPTDFDWLILRIQIAEACACLSCKFMLRLYPGVWALISAIASMLHIQLLFERENFMVTQE